MTATSTFARSMGQVIGVTVFGAIFAAGLLAAAGPGADPEMIGAMPDEAITSAIRGLYRAGLVPIAITLLLTTMLPPVHLHGGPRPAGARPDPRPPVEPHPDQQIHPDDPSGMT